MRRPWRGATLALVLLAAVTPAAAERLVTRDGATFLTRGPWQLAGERVVFHTREGRFVSLQASQIDFTRSGAELPAAAPADTSLTARAARRPVWRIDDEDLPRRLHGGEAAFAGSLASAGDAASAGEEASGEGDGAVIVAAWERTPVGGGTTIRGSLLNRGPLAHRAVEVRIVLLADGMVVGERTVPATSMLAPGTRAAFAARFPDVARIDAVRFVVSGTP